MNLDRVLTSAVDDSELVNHEWMETGLTQPGKPILNIQDIKNDNNIKPELEMQWGGGMVIMDDPEPSGVVYKTNEDGPDKSDVILFARDLMNRGYMGRDLSRRLRAAYDPQTLQSAASGLKEQFKLEGIVGCVAVDGRGYDNCRDAVEAAENSPNKHFIKYVIGCECGTPHMLPVEGRDLLASDIQTTGNPMDDFLGSSDDDYKPLLASHCRSTMMPLLASDLDPSEVDSGMIDMVRLTGLPAGVAKKVRENKAGVQAFQAAFRWLQLNREKQEDAKYAGKVDASEHMISPTDMQVDVAPEIKRETVAVCAQPNRGFEIELTGTGPDIGLINLPGSDQLQVDVGSEFVAQDVNPETFVDEIFAGTDEVDLDAPRRATNELDIEL